MFLCVPYFVVPPPLLLQAKILRLFSPLGGDARPRCYPGRPTALLPGTPDRCYPGRPGGHKRPGRPWSQRGVVTATWVGGVRCFTQLETPINELLAHPHINFLTFRLQIDLKLR